MPESKLTFSKAKEIISTSDDVNKAVEQSTEVLFGKKTVGRQADFKQRYSGQRGRSHPPTVQHSRSTLPNSRTEFTKPRTSPHKGSTCDSSGGSHLRSH